MTFGTHGQHVRMSVVLIGISFWFVHHFVFYSMQYQLIYSIIFHINNTPKFAKELPLYIRQKFTDFELHFGAIIFPWDYKRAVAQWTSLNRTEPLWQNALFDNSYLIKSIEQSISRVVWKQFWATISGSVMSYSVFKLNTEILVIHIET